MSPLSLNTYRVPSKYFSADTLNNESSYTHVDVPPVKNDGPTLKPAAALLTVYANLTLGNVLRQSSDNPSARIDFKQVPSFQTDARSAAKKISKEEYDDPQELIEFGRMLKVPMRYGPDAWAFIMQKVGDKLERMGIWKHKAGQSIKKSLEIAVQTCLSEGRFGGDWDDVEGFEDDGIEEYGGARKRLSKSPRQQTPPAPRQQTPPTPRRRVSWRSDDGLEESEEDDRLPSPASLRRSSKSPRQQTPPAARRRSASRSVTPPDGADSASSDEGYGSDGSNHGHGNGIRGSAEVAKLRTEILRKVASKKDLEVAMAEGDVKVEALLADKTDEVREEVRRSVDKVSQRVKKLQGEVTDHGRRIESSEEGLLNLMEETKSDDYMALVARRLQALKRK
ncbi:hypothetical protein AC578_7306 [Pseudocercospora eumusae]|uniref:Uncharacterized protein n=1 Tax=Pseudocercospora eumusae TaxID=321146 RepID=A0A139HWS2_9PEZI|nr:hypothetical protein AC578_7306 [Pseudocercospora eumusae]